MKLVAAISLALMVAACGSVGQPSGSPGTGAAGSAAAATPAPTPGPSRAPVDVYAGRVIFGSTLNPEQLIIAAPLSSFARATKSIAWVAHLSEPAGATTVTVTIARISGATERIVHTEALEVLATDAVVGRKANLTALVGRRAGTYVMRVLRDATVLAEGTFKLT